MPLFVCHYTENCNEGGRDPRKGGRKGPRKGGRKRGRGGRRGGRKDELIDGDSAPAS